MSRTITPEKAREMAAKSAVTRAANRAAKAAAAAQETPSNGDLPPNPPANYGRLPESRFPGGAIDPATRSSGVDLDAQFNRADGRPLAPDVVGDLTPPRAKVKVARDESELPFSTERGGPRASSPKRLPAGEVEVMNAPEPQLGTTIQLPDWNSVDLQEGQDILDATYALLQTAAQTLQRRMTDRERNGGLKCEQCGKPIPDARDAKMLQAHRDMATGLITNKAWCSHRCFTGFVASGQASRAANE